MLPNCILYWICLSKEIVGKNYFPILQYGKGSSVRLISHNFFALDTPISSSPAQSTSPALFLCPWRWIRGDSLQAMSYRAAGLNAVWNGWERGRGPIGILWPLPPSLSIVHSHQDWSGHQTPSHSLTITCSVQCTAYTSIPNKQLNFLHCWPIFLWKCFMCFPAPQKEINVLKLSYNRKIFRFSSTVFSSSFPIRWRLFSQSFDVFLSIKIIHRRFLGQRCPRTQEAMWTRFLKNILLFAQRRPARLPGKRWE